MRPSVVFEQNRQFIRDAVARRRTANPRIFGSVLHGTDREDSDIDIVVDALPGATMGDLNELEDELNERLGVPVHVKTANELSKYFRDDVLAEAEPV